MIDTTCFFYGLLVFLTLFVLIPAIWLLTTRPKKWYEDEPIIPPDSEQTP